MCEGLSREVHTVNSAFAASQIPLLRWPDSRESIRRFVRIAWFAHHRRVPLTEPLFCETRFGALETANRWSGAFRANRLNVLKIGIFLRIDSRELIHANRRCESPGHLSSSVSVHNMHFMVDAPLTSTFVKVCDSFTRSNCTERFFLGNRLRFLCGNGTVAVAMHFAMKSGKISFSLWKFLAISPAVPKIASDCGCDAVVHLVLDKFWIVFLLCQIS